MSDSIVEPCPWTLSLVDVEGLHLGHQAVHAVTLLICDDVAALCDLHAIPNGGRGDPRGMVEDRDSLGRPLAGQQHAVGTLEQGLDCT